jgi:hypothetical protein
VGDGAGANGCVIVGAQTSNVQLIWAGAGTTFGGGLGVVGIYNAGALPSAVPTNGAAIGHDSIGLHYFGPSTSLLDYMVAPAQQGTANTQQNKSRVYSGVCRTTTNSAVTLLTIPLATSSTDGAFLVLVTGRDQSAGTVNDGVSFCQLVQFKNNAGTITAAATQGTAMKANDTSMAGCTLSFTVSGTNVLVQVTGLSSVNVDWYGEARAIVN